MGLGLAALMAGGGALSAVDAVGKNQRAKEQNKAIQANALKMQAELGDTEARRMQSLGAQYAPMVGGDFAGDTKDFYNDLENADYGQFNLQAPDDFAYDTQAETQKFMNPMIQDIINRATGEVTNSAANAGKLFSGATAKGIARSTADIQAQEYGKAANLAQQERTNKYQQWTDKFNQARQIAEAGRSNMQAGLDTKGKKYGMQAQAYGQQIGSQQDIQNATDTARLQSIQQAMDAGVANKGIGSNLMAGIGGALSGAGNVYGTFGGMSAEK